MKRKIVIPFLIALGVLFLFNPHDKSGYVSWVKDEMKEDAGFLTYLISPVVDHSTKKHNFGLFTVYKTDFSEDDRLMAVGILNNYIWIKGLPKE